MLLVIRLRYGRPPLLLDFLSVHLLILDGKIDLVKSTFLFANSLFTVPNQELMYLVLCLYLRIYWYNWLIQICFKQRKINNSDLMPPTSTRDVHAVRNWRLGRPMSCTIRIETTTAATTSTTAMQFEVAKIASRGIHYCSK